MTKEGQKTHNVPNSVRLWGKFDILPASWLLEQDMKEHIKQKEAEKSKEETDIIPFKTND